MLSEYRIRLSQKETLAGLHTEPDETLPSDPSIGDLEITDERNSDSEDDRHTVPYRDSDVPDHHADSPVFSDVNPDAWYYEAVCFVSARGIMNGNGDGSFSPDSKLTRAMIVQILYNLEGRPSATTGNQFSDVVPDKWYASAVSWAVSSGLVEGYDGRFDPDKDITREQLVTILRRYSVYLGKNAIPAGGNIIIY